MARPGGNDSKELLLQVDASVELARGKLGSLAREVDTQSKKMDADLRKVDVAADRMGGGFDKLTKKIADGFTIAAVATLGRQVLQFGDELDAAAEKAGIGVERYQTLKAALRELEVDAENVDKTFQILQATIGDVQSGVETGATKALAKLGITTDILSGKITTADQLLDAIAVSSGKAGTQAQFASDLVDIFGKKLGLELVPALSNSGAALQDAEQRVREFGAVLSEDMVRELAEANEALDWFWQRAKAEAAIGAAGIIRTIRDVINAFRELPTGSVWGQIAGTVAAGGPSIALSLAGGWKGPTVDQLRANVQRARAAVAASQRAIGPGGRWQGSPTASGLGQNQQRLRAAEAELRAAEQRGRAGAGAVLNDVMGPAGFARLGREEFSPPRVRRGGGGGSGSHGGGGARARPAKRELTGDEAREAWLSANEKKHEFDLSFEEAVGDGLELQGTLTGIDQLLLKIGTEDMPNLGDMLPEEQAARIRDFVMDFEHDLASGLADAIVNGEDLGDVLVNSLKRAAAAIIESGILELLGMLSGQGSGQGGQLFQSLASAIGLGKLPGRALGGPVEAGKMYMVGERGPEPFIPRVSGTILPNSALKGAGGGEIHVRFSLDNDMLRAEVINTSGQMMAAARPHIEAGAASKAIDLLMRHRLPGLG